MKPTYSLTKIRTFTGMEGYGLNAVICRDGKPVAFVLDDASGGPTQIDFTNPGQSARSYEQHCGTSKIEEAAAHAFALDWLANSPEAEASRAVGAEIDEKFPDSKREPSGDDALVDWVNHYVDEAQNKKRLDRAAKTKTLFRLPTDERGAWRTLSTPYCEKVREHLAKKYPGVQIEVYGVEKRAAA